MKLLDLPAGDDVVANIAALYIRHANENLEGVQQRRLPHSGTARNSNYYLL